MVDEINTTNVNPVVPAVETVVSIPTAETSPSIDTNISQETPAVSSDTIASETSKAETPTPSEADSVLGAEPVVEKKEEVKPDVKALDAKTPIEGEKPSEAKKVEFPTYEEFKLPDGVKLDKEPVEAFTKILGEIETGKLDHKGMQDAGQKLIDLAAKNTVDSINRLNDYYVELHKSNVQKRVETLKADPELGGQNFEKTVSALQESVRTYGGTEAQIADFRKEITESGLSASPAVCRLIYNMQQKINKYTTENSGPSIVPGQKPAAVKVKPYEAFYKGGAA